MMKAFDLVARFFTKPSDSPSVDGIAQGLQIAGSATSFLNLVITLKVLTLKAPQRQGMTGKGDPNQRSRSEQFQGFLVKRPDFDQRVQIDPTTFQTIIDKDESYDVLLSTLTLCRQFVSDSQLLLEAWLSGKLGIVLTYVGKLMAPNAPAQDLPERINFGAVVVAQGEQQMKVTDHQSRLQRKHEAPQQSLAQAQNDKTTQLQIDKLTQDALAGAGPLQQAQTQALPPATKPVKATRTHKSPAPKTTKTKSTKTKAKTKSTKAKSKTKAAG
jgi:hypothetical protein